MSALTLPACLITQPVQFEAPTGFPPSIETSSLVAWPLDDIVRFQLDDTSVQPDFEVEVRDPDVDETLVYLVYVDFVAAAGLTADDSGTLPPIDRAAGTDRTRRRLTFQFPPRLVTPGCHRLELFVSGDFRLQTRDPLRAGDLGTAVWWVASQSTSSTEVNMVACP
jgi:hypothetical protein